MKSVNAVLKNKTIKKSDGAAPFRLQGGTRKTSENHFSQCGWLYVTYGYNTDRPCCKGRSTGGTYCQVKETYFSQNARERDCIRNAKKAGRICGDGFQTDGSKISQGGGGSSTVRKENCQACCERDCGSNQSGGIVNKSPDSFGSGGRRPGCFF